MGTSSRSFLKLGDDMPGTSSAIGSQDAADRLGYTRQHVRRLIRAGHLRGRKLGRDWFVDPDSVGAYLASLENHELPLDPRTERGSAKASTNTHTESSVRDIMSGGEASLERKRLAKRLAWDNGGRPEFTTHTIRTGDARSMAEIKPGSIHLVVTSPPYFDLVEYEAAQRTSGQIGNLGDYESFLAELTKVWKRCFDALVPGGRLCVVVGDVCLSRRSVGRHHVLPLHADISLQCRQLGFDYLTPILWSKIANMSTEVGGGSRFLGKPYEPNAIIKNDTEYVLLFRKPGSYRKPTHMQRALSLLDAEDHRKWFRSAWTDIRGESRKAGHPAPFPVEIPFRLINMFSFVGDTVLDPFWGTGTTTVAALRATRSSAGYEIERAYLEIGRDRLAQVDNSVVPPRIDFVGLS